jgi:hypothetical protein
MARWRERFFKIVEPAPTTTPHKQPLMLMRRWVGERSPMVGQLRGTERSSDRESCGKAFARFDPENNILEIQCPNATADCD